MSFLSNIFSKEKEELNTIEGQEKPSELEIYFQQFRKYSWNRTIFPISLREKRNYLYGLDS